MGSSSIIYNIKVWFLRLFWNSMVILIDDVDDDEFDKLDKADEV